MPKFRKKPVVIEARRFSECAPQVENDIVEWIIGWGGYAAVEHDGHESTLIKIVTLEGVVCASAGDWVIRGVKNEFYPCKDDIFRATYEAAE